MAFIPGGDRLPGNRRPDQRYNPPPKGALAAGGRAGILRARQVIVSGANDGVFVYNGNPAAGNLLSTDTGQAGVDQFGNHYLAGQTFYGVGSALNIIGTTIQWFTGSLSGGWTFGSQFIQAPSAATLQVAGHPVTLGTQVVVSGSIPATPVGGGQALLEVQGAQFLANVSAPAGHSGGGFLYVTGGALHYVGSSGTDTTLAPA